MAETICLPMKVDAFILNPAVCNGSKSKIAPITQPNYTFLRLDNNTIQNDVLDHVDLHAASPASCNRRLMDIGTNTVRANRQGVYVSWTLPRVYRTGTAAAPKAAAGEAARQTSQGYPQPASNADYSAPNFRNTPNRWLVVRKLSKTNPPNTIKTIQAWVIDSDYRWSLDSLDDSVDLEIDVSPFIFPVTDQNDPIEQQAEVFIGRKLDADAWSETPGADRVPLTLLNTANPLFGDFQPHNSNVFSIVDNFAYGDPKTPQYLITATASYSVIGWHSSAAADVFTISPPGISDLGSRLDACMLALQDTDSTSVKNWTADTNGTRLLCHGAMYDVEWDIENAPATILADKAFDNLHNNMPVAIGTTPLDALLAFVNANVGSAKDNLLEVESDIIAIQSLLISQDDGVDSLMEANDMLYNHNFEKTQGGTLWHLSGDDGTGKPTTPDQPVLDALNLLNSMQLALDTASRRSKQLSWELFSAWWRYISDPDQNDSKFRFADCVKCLVGKIRGLQTLISGLQSDISTNSGAFPAIVAATQNPFFLQRDPTLLVGSIQPGWPSDFLENLVTRIDSQIVTDSASIGIDNDISGFLTSTLGKVFTNQTPAMLSTAKKLLQEFSLLQPETKLFTPSKGQFFPLYHDQSDLDNPDSLWRDRWGSVQPWSPLFLEWEGEYCDIPYEWWSLDERAVRGSIAGSTQVRYGIQDGIVLADSMKSRLEDVRTISGRVLMLPQPGYSLANRINQLFQSTSQTILQQSLSLDEQTQLVKKLKDLQMISAPMSGFTEHLLTRAIGSHIKPLQRTAGETATPMPAAYAKTQIDIGMGEAELKLVGLETDVTPYGSLVERLDPDVSAFKPCTHGQFRFTKFNIIDKFGQGIAAIDPTPSKTGPPPLYPCISDYYSCQNLKGTTNANTVTTELPGACEYIQINPSINQDSRLNFCFVRPDGNNTVGWMPVNEWEQPVWGWLVVNYADYGLQIFLPNGTFYLEVRLGGPTGTSLPKNPWQPFSPPPDSQSTTQLDFFASQLNNKDYLQSFFDMLNGAYDNLPAAPNSYSQYLSSIIGKPLALVNFGVSLELASDPLKNQSSRNFIPPRIPLLAPGTLPEDCTSCLPQGSSPLPPTKPEVPPAPSNYTFAVKFGDQARSYDGLIGYFNSTPSSSVSPTTSNLDLSTLYTYFPSPLTSSSNPTHPISSSILPSVAPYYIRPDNLDTATFTSQRNKQLKVFGAIVDPFTAFHAYTGILPIGTLKLPSWTVQSALEKMTAFFHVGPIITTSDVPPFSADYELTSAQDEKIMPTGPGGTGGIGIPSLPIGDWAWLQPYVQKEKVPGEGVDGEETRFMALPIAKVDSIPRFEKGPYVAVEGYLQLRQPLSKPDGIGGA